MKDSDVQWIISEIEDILEGTTYEELEQGLRALIKELDDTEYSPCCGYPYTIEYGLCSNCNEHV